MLLIHRKSMNNFLHILNLTLASNHLAVSKECLIVTFLRQLIDLLIQKKILVSEKIVILLIIMEI